MSLLTRIKYWWYPLSDPELLKQKERECTERHRPYNEASMDLLLQELIDDPNMMQVYGGNLKTAELFRAFMEKSGIDMDAPRKEEWADNAPIADIIAHVRKFGMGDYNSTEVERLCAEIERLQEQNAELRDMFKQLFGNNIAETFEDSLKEIGAKIKFAEENMK